MILGLGRMVVTLISQLTLACRCSLHLALSLRWQVLRHTRWTSILLHPPAEKTCLLRRTVGIWYNRARETERFCRMIPAIRRFRGVLPAGTIWRSTVDAVIEPANDNVVNYQTGPVERPGDTNSQRATSLLPGAKPFHRCPDMPITRSLIVTEAAGLTSFCSKALAFVREIEQEVIRK